MLNRVSAGLGPSETGVAFKDGCKVFYPDHGAILIVIRMVEARSGDGLRDYSRVIIYTS